MPKRKRGGARGRGGRHSFPRQPRLQDIATAFRPSSDRPHTMQDEVRNTTRHHDNWDSDHKLRYNKIDFVSAGNFDSNRLLEVNDDSEVLPPNDGEEGRESGIEDEASPGDKMAQADKLNQLRVHDEKLEEDSIPTTDTIESHSQPTALSNARPTSPTPSSSSEEVIVFRGRDKLKASDETPTEDIDVKIRVIEEEIQIREQALKMNSRAPPRTNESFQPDVQARYRGRRLRADETSDEDDAILRDYIQNMREQEEHEEDLETYNTRDLGGSDGDVWHEEAQPSTSRPNISEDNRMAGWDRTDLYDLDDLSTSDGVKGSVEMILSKRIRHDALQYLVVWDNDTVDDARWVNLSTLDQCGCQDLISRFEEEEKQVADYVDTASSSDDDSESSDIRKLREDIIEVEFDDDDDDEAVEGLRMSDETIARLLAKQEQLGLGSGDLVLFDGLADFEDADEDTSDVAPKWSETKRRQKKANKGYKQNKGLAFPSATRLADAYDGFDVMDFERPSLKKKPKGRKGPLSFDLSDSELAETMQEAWEKDRLRKKEKKQQREDLRSQGLLGSKNGKINMKDKYKEGMTFDDLKTEFMRFLKSEHTTLSLAPMDKKDRKIVHEFAQAFSLKSKSTGSGDRRFPTIYRTQQTRPFSASAFAAVELRLQRRFLSRKDVKGRGRSENFKVSRSGGSSAVTYRDGDVVGGSAPEIGIENKGRAMLEKMGWSSGTALGAINNKGILIPVSHVVKTTKAGLG